MKPLRNPAVGRCRLTAWVLTAALVVLAGCQPEPPPEVVKPQTDDPTADWDMYVTRHMGRGLGRLQFKLPPGWRVTYQHDTVHPRIIVADRADLKAPDISYLVIGMTEKESFDGPPAVWNAANYSPETDPVKRQLLDRKRVVEHRGHMGQGVTWRTTQIAPVVGDWEYVWKFGVDPGPGAVNRDKQRVNKFDKYMAENPGSPVNYFREFYTLGWGVQPFARLQIFYKARNPETQTLFESMLPSIEAYQHSESEVTLLGGAITKPAWEAIVARDRVAQPPAAGQPEPTP